LRSKLFKDTGLSPGLPMENAGDTGNGYGNAFRSVALALGLLCVFGVFHPVHAADLVPLPLDVGFTKTCFAGVNQNDAQASLKGFMAAVGRKRGYDVRSNVMVFEDTRSCQEAVKKKGKQLVIVTAWQYLSMDLKKTMDPVFVPACNGLAGRKYVILTHKGSGLNNLGDLKGKEITQLEMGSANMGPQWLQTLLLGSGLGNPDRFFSKVEVVHKAPSAVLPVFFGNRSACLIDVPAFEIMAELNPQLKNKLQIIASSEPYVDDVICLSKDGWDSEEQRSSVIESLADLHREPAGQQILTLFKVEKLVPFEEKYLDSLRKLHKTYEEAGKTIKH